LDVCPISKRVVAGSSVAQVTTASLSVTPPAVTAIRCGGEVSWNAVVENVIREDAAGPLPEGSVDLTRK